MTTATETRGDPATESLTLAPGFVATEYHYCPNGGLTPALAAMKTRLPMSNWFALGTINANGNTTGLGVIGLSEGAVPAAIRTQLAENKTQRVFII